MRVALCVGLQLRQISLKKIMMTRLGFVIGAESLCIPVAMRLTKTHLKTSLFVICAKLLESLTECLLSVRFVNNKAVR
jgi:hypothetical protein